MLFEHKNRHFIDEISRKFDLIKSVERRSRASVACNFVSLFMVSCGSVIVSELNGLIKHQG